MPLSPESPAAHPLPSSSARRPRSLASLARRRLSGAAPSLVALACYLLAVFGPFWNGTSGSGGGGGGGGGAGGGEGLGARPTLVGLAYLAVSAAALLAAPLKEVREASPAPRPPSQTPHSWSRAWPAASGSVAALALLHSLAQLAAALPTPARRRLLPEDEPLRRFVAETVGLVVVKESSWGKHPYEASLQLARAVAGPVALLCLLSLASWADGKARGEGAEAEEEDERFSSFFRRLAILHSGKVAAAAVFCAAAGGITDAVPPSAIGAAVAVAAAASAAALSGPSAATARGLSAAAAAAAAAQLSLALWALALYALRVPWLREAALAAAGRGAAARLSWLGLLPPEEASGEGRAPGSALLPLAAAAAAVAVRRESRRWLRERVPPCEREAAAPEQPCLLFPFALVPGGGGAAAAAAVRVEEGEEEGERQAPATPSALVPPPPPSSSPPSSPLLRAWEATTTAVRGTTSSSRARHARLWAARVLENLWSEFVGAEAARSLLVVAAFAAPTALSIVLLGVAAASGRPGAPPRRVAGAVAAALLALEVLVRVGGPPPAVAPLLRLPGGGDGGGTGHGGVGGGGGNFLVPPALMDWLGIGRVSESGFWALAAAAGAATMLSATDGWERERSEGGRGARRSWLAAVPPPPSRPSLRPAALLPPSLLPPFFAPLRAEARDSGSWRAADRLRYLLLRRAGDGLLVAVVALCCTRDDALHAAYLASALLLFRTRAGARAKAATEAMEEEEEEEGRGEGTETETSSRAATAAAVAVASSSPWGAEELAWLPALNVAAMALQLLFQAPFDLDGGGGNGVESSLRFSSSPPPPPPPPPPSPPRCDFAHLMGLFKFRTRGLSWSAGAGADVALFALLALHSRMAATAAALDAARIAAGDRAAAARAVARRRAEAARAQALGALEDARATAARAARVASLKKGVTRSGAGFGIDLGLLEDAPPIVDEEEDGDDDGICGEEREGAAASVAAAAAAPPSGVSVWWAERARRGGGGGGARLLGLSRQLAPQRQRSRQQLLEQQQQQRSPFPSSSSPKQQLLLLFLRRFLSKLRSGPVACAALALLWVSDTSLAGALACAALLGYALVAQAPSRRFWLSTLAASELLLVAQYVWLATMRLGCCEGGGRGQGESGGSGGGSGSGGSGGGGGASVSFWASRLGLHSTAARATPAFLLYLAVLAHAHALPPPKKRTERKRRRTGTGAFAAAAEEEEEEEGEEGEGASLLPSLARTGNEGASTTTRLLSLNPFHAFFLRAIGLLSSTSRRFSLPARKVRAFFRRATSAAERPLHWVLLELAPSPSPASSSKDGEERRASSSSSSSAAAAAAASPVEVEALREYLCTREGAQDLQERVDSALLLAGGGGGGGRRRRNLVAEAVPLRAIAVESFPSSLSSSPSSSLLTSNAGVIAALFEVIPRSIDDDEEEGDRRRRGLAAPPPPLPSLAPAAEVAAALSSSSSAFDAKGTVRSSSLSSSPPPSPLVTPRWSLAAAHAHSRAPTDFYALTFAADAAALAYAALFFNSVVGSAAADVAAAAGSPSSPSSAATAAASAAAAAAAAAAAGSRALSPAYLGTLFVLFSFALADRVAYALGSTALKFWLTALHAAAACSAVSSAFWSSSAVRQGSASARWHLRAFSAMQLLSLCCSAAQLRSGYPPRAAPRVGGGGRSSPFFRGRVGRLGAAAAGLAAAVPFLFELRCLIDWAVTPTALTLADWLKLDDVSFSLHSAACARAARDRGRRLGEARRGAAKLAQGAALAAALLLLVWVPLLAFSAGSPSWQAPAVVGFSFAVDVVSGGRGGGGGAPPAVGGRLGSGAPRPPPRPAADSPSSLLRVRLFSAAGRVSVGPAARSGSGPGSADLLPQLAAAGYAPEQVQLACASRDSDAAWRASPPAAAAAAALLREASSPAASSSSSSSPPPAVLVFSWTVDRSAPAPSAHGGPRCAGAAPVALSGPSAAELASVLEEGAAGGGRGSKERLGTTRAGNLLSLLPLSRGWQRQKQQQLRQLPRVARLRAASFPNGTSVPGGKGTRALFPLLWHLRGTACVAAPGGDAFSGGGGGGGGGGGAGGSSGGASLLFFSRSRSSNFPAGYGAADADGTELATAAVACDAELLSAASAAAEEERRRGGGGEEGDGGEREGEEAFFVADGGGETISSALLQQLRQLQQQPPPSSSPSWWRLSCEVVAEDGSSLSPAAASRLSRCGGEGGGEGARDGGGGGGRPGGSVAGETSGLGLSAGGGGGGPRIVAVLDRVQAGVLGATLSSFGITGLYFTFVLGAVSFFSFFAAAREKKKKKRGKTHQEKPIENPKKTKKQARFVRLATRNQKSRILFEDLPDTSRLSLLVSDIQTARAAGELALEEELFFSLLNIYRRPDVLFELTTARGGGSAAREDAAAVAAGEESSGGGGGDGGWVGDTR